MYDTRSQLTAAYFMSFNLPVILFMHSKGWT